jgi:hypothetical protein
VRRKSPLIDEDANEREVNVELCGAGVGTGRLRFFLEGFDSDADEVPKLEDAAIVCCDREEALLNLIRATFVTSGASIGNEGTARMCEV